MSLNNDMSGPERAPRGGEAPGRAASPGKRVERIEFQGRPAWLKRVEVMNARTRIQKGDPAIAFERERQSYALARELALPFPKVLDEGPDYLVTGDAGVTLHSLARRKTTPPEILQRALLDGAAALGRLHRKGYSHGRPAFRDVCWDDGEVTFIDLEKFDPAKRDKKNFAADILIFFFSLFADTGMSEAEAVAAKEAYLSQAPAEYWQMAERRVRALQWLRPPLSPLLYLLRNKREFRAITPFLRFFRTSTRPEG